MKYKFRVEFLEEANEFLAGLDEKPRGKIFYNIWKARSVNDKELFKTTDKIPKSDIDKAERLRQKYFNDKKKKK